MSWRYKCLHALIAICKYWYAHTVKQSESNLTYPKYLINSDLIMQRFHGHVMHLKALSD